jgi:hypothetical protein
MPKPQPSPAPTWEKPVGPKKAQNLPSAQSRDLRGILFAKHPQKAVLKDGLWSFTNATGESLFFNPATQAGQQLFTFCAFERNTCAIRALVDKNNVVQELLVLESDSPLTGLISETLRMPTFPNASGCAKTITHIHFALNDDPDLSMLEQAMNASLQTALDPDKKHAVDMQGKWSQQIDVQCSSALNSAPCKITLHGFQMCMGKGRP